MTDPREKIDRMRRDRGWSLSQLAKKIGVSETAVYNWYNEKNSMPTVFILADVCDVFGVTLSELFSDAEADRLTPAQMECLELFGRLPDKKQRAALEVLRVLAE